MSIGRIIVISRESTSEMMNSCSVVKLMLNVVFQHRLEVFTRASKKKTSA